MDKSNEIGFKVDKSESSVTPWTESPVQTVWRKVAEDPFVSLDRIQSIFTDDVPQGQSLGERLVRKRLHR
jgi:hypothetical protein